VLLSDAFWEPRRRINREVTLASQYRRCEETGRIDNFRRAAGKKQGPFQGRYYNDSDVYKWVEACAFALAEGPDAEIERMLDTVVREIADAQQPDGYLNTYFTFERQEERWTNLKDRHELYCAGHLIQAAVAHTASPAAATSWTSPFATRTTSARSSAPRAGTAPAATRKSRWRWWSCTGLPARSATSPRPACSSTAAVRSRR
jgi:DUF1680 family protein